MFEEFLGKEVKAPFNDAGQPRVARGTLVSYDQNLVKIKGELGTIIIGRNEIYKMGLLNKEE